MLVIDIQFNDVDTIIYSHLIQYQCVLYDNANWDENVKFEI